MADQNDPIQLDVNVLLNDFAIENSKLTGRAIVAEAKCREYLKIIQAQQKRIDELEERVHIFARRQSEANLANVLGKPEA